MEMARRADRFDRDATLHCMEEIFKSLMDSYILVNDISPGLTTPKFLDMLKLMHDKYEALTGVALPLHEFNTPEPTSDSVEDFAVIDKP